MATYTKIPLSLIPTGIPLNVGFFTQVHSTLTSATVKDEVWLYVTNNGLSSTVEITITNGITNVTFANTIPGDGYNYFELVIPGLIFSGDGTVATDIYVGDTAGSAEIYVSGFVNRVTP